MSDEHSDEQPTIQATVRVYYTLIDGEWTEQTGLGREVNYYTDEDEPASPNDGFPAHPDDSYDYEVGGFQPLVPDRADS